MGREGRCNPALGPPGCNALAQSCIGDNRNRKRREAKRGYQTRNAGTHHHDFVLFFHLDL
jgi:hypothetical protein